MQHIDYAGKDKAREILRMVLINDWEIISPILQPYKWQGCKFEKRFCENERTIITFNLNMR